MWVNNINFIPVNVSVWLQEIRKTTDQYEEIVECKIGKNNFGQSSSNESVYDNVEGKISRYSNLDDNVEIIRLSDFFGKSKEAKPVRFVEEKIYRATWPLKKYKMKIKTFSFEYLPEQCFWGENSKNCFCLKGGTPRDIDFNWLDYQGTTIKRALKPSDIIRGRKDLSDYDTQEERQPNIFNASMSNRLASHRENNIQECVWSWLNASQKEHQSKDDLFGEIFQNAKDKLNDTTEIMTLTCTKEYVNDIFQLQFFEEHEKNCRKVCPTDFLPPFNINVKKIFDGNFVAEKPPAGPKRRKRRMDQRHQSSALLAQNRRLRKSHMAKAKAVPIPTIYLKTKNSVSSSIRSTQPRESLCESSPINLLEMAEDSEDKDNTKKPLPFPAYNPELEYEINELLMMQRVTESSKGRRRMSTERKTCPILENPNWLQGCSKNIPTLSFRSPDESSKGDMSEDVLSLVSNVSDNAETQIKVFIESKKNKKVKYERQSRIPSKGREDVIIDWDNGFENIDEPVVLEGKSVIWKRFPSFRLQNQNGNKVSITESPDESGNFKTWDDISAEKVDFSNNNSTNTSTDDVFSQSSDHSQSKFCTEYSEDKSSKIRSCSKVTEIVTRYDTVLEEGNHKLDSEIFDKILCSSISEGLNSFSDFESDINETIATGEMWCKLSDENISLTNCDTLEDLSKSTQRQNVDGIKSGLDSQMFYKVYTTIIEHKLTGPGSTLVGLSEGKLDTIAEIDNDNDGKETEKKISPKDGIESFHVVKRAKSDSDLLTYTAEKVFVEKALSKSSNFFRDSLAETRLESKVFRKRSSITSDVCEWMTRIRGIAFPEDGIFSDEDEWILSFDSEERAYFFEETSKKSLWALPDYSSEDIKLDFNFSIQRSATESAIPKDPARLEKNGSNKGRISTSTRSSKAQSMLIEPKFDISSKDETKTYSMPRDLFKIYGEIIRFGVLNKTKILENGKKLRKNWTPAFVVLSESYLFFFKDAKSFQNMKNVIGSNVNHMCLSLQGAVIEKGDKISSRKNVYKISCLDNTEVLIQTDKTQEAEEWFKQINTVIENLPRDSFTTSGSPILDSNFPSKVGRTKSLKVRNKETGSMEDLSSTAEERQNKIKARLKKFFIRRPTVDSLKKKGIWKDEPVFGCSLEQITKNRNPRVPLFVEKCIESIESKEENIKTDGLYRASGNLSQVQKIRLEVDQNNLSIMKDEEDVHVLTGSLKLFFRELKEPLIPSKQLEPALLATDKQNRKDRIKDFQKIVKSLPAPNYDTLKFLLQHLLRVKEYHKFNRMNINNLAIVFGPTLMWPEQESANMALELMQQNVVIECLLKEFHEIFT